MNEAEAHELCGYLSRMLDRSVAIEDTVALRSVQRAALSSWARRKGIGLNAAIVGPSASFSVGALLDPVAAVESEPKVATFRTSPAMAKPPMKRPLAVGIDIEDIENLPCPDDYREHPFFHDHFTAAEIAYCLRQPNVPASFCGLWAAKEAILKSGLMQDLAVSLKAIEISHDTFGQPIFDQCELSISHTRHSAIAICITSHA